MNAWRALVLITALCGALQGSAQFSINSSVISCGGGVITGGAFAITGTIGQPQTAISSGGRFQLQGGFWGVIAAVQTPGGPHLSIDRADSLITVFWPSLADGWVLERTSALAGGGSSWSPINGPYASKGNNLSATFTNMPSGSNQYFRLRKP